jgi:type VI protein secretion system component VasF
MIHAWLIAARLFLKRLPWQVWAALGALVLIITLWGWHRSSVNSAASDGIQQGRQEQREETLETIIKRTEQANDARQEIEREIRIGNGDNLYRNCLRTARTPAHCERFLLGE